MYATDADAFVPDTLWDLSQTLDDSALRTFPSLVVNDFSVVSYEGDLQSESGMSDSPRVA